MSGLIVRPMTFTESELEELSRKIPDASLEAQEILARSPELRALVSPDAETRRLAFIASMRRHVRVVPG